MNHFDYRDGVLSAERVALPLIAEAVGTPFYCYASATLERHYRVFKDSLAGLDSTVCFAVKANPNLAVLKTFAQLGAGADVVSEGELRRALQAGVPASRIVFSGVGKARHEIEFALAAGIKQINVESAPELDAIAQVAAAMGKRATIGVRVNPNIDAHTHAKITTGKKENKFGVEPAEARALYARAAAMDGVEPVAVAAHIGSQLTDLAPFAEAFAFLRDFVLTLRADGLAVGRVDVGGGLGIRYDRSNNEPPAPREYGDLLRRHFQDLAVEVVLEPGRVLVGNAGVLVASVIYIKNGSSRSFLICDAGMNDLVRPALYDAFHDILPVVQPTPGAKTRAYDVVGPICETGDTFARKRPLPLLAEGDLIAFGGAGAYGAAMSSTYNLRPLVPEVIVKDDAFAVVRARPTYEDMLAGEGIPDWLR